MHDHGDGDDSCGNLPGANTCSGAADANYAIGYVAGTQTVQAATPIVTMWPTASAITYGQTLGASILSGGTASVLGSFAWTAPGAVPLAGTDSESVTFVPSDPTDYSGVTGTVNVTVNPASYIVTVSTDDAGTASNCTPQSTPGHGTDASCSLRDALLEAAATGGGNIGFDATAFSAATTIELSNGALSLPSATTIAGATTGSGATLADLVTVDGQGASTVFTVVSGVTGASLANLTIQHGSSTVSGGGIENAGTLTLSGDSIIGNTASGTGAGGGIYNSGTLAVSGSTISGNTAGGNGGGIVNGGTLTLVDDTISGNSASGSGGGIYTSATLVVSDSTLSGNTAGTASGGGGIDNAGSGSAALANAILSGNSSNSTVDDFDGAAYTDNSGNVVGVANGATVNGSAIALAPLGSYGGPAQTMIPLPGSAAICAGLASAIPSGVTTDERGLPNSNASYPGYPACVDAGAVQTNYALIFTTQPAGAAVNADFAAAVTLNESGSPFPPAVTIPLTLTGNGTLSGGTAATSSGVASYTLEVSAAGSSDALTANLTLNGGPTPAVAISAASNSFAIGQATPAFTSLTVSQIVTYGTSSIALSGVISAGSDYPPSGETVSITIGSTTVTPSIGANGVFSATFDTHAIPASSTAYTITYSYGGDANFKSAADTNTTLTVKQAALTVTASSSTVTYGAAVPMITPTYSGFVNGQTSSVLTTQPTCTTTYTTTSDAGTAPTTSCSGAAATNYSFTYVSGTVTVNQAALTVEANNATKVYGTANPVFTGSIVGAVNGDAFTESFSTSATTSSNVGNYAIVPSATGANLADYSVAVQNGTLAITEAGTTISLSAGSASINPGQSVTLTAQVVSVTTGTPTGSVNFYDGATLLDTAVLTGNTASFSITTLSAGTTHQLTAVYSGDSNFLTSSTSSSISIVVAALNFSVTPVAPTSQTVNPGSAATYQVVVAPTYGTYPGTVTFTATGLPSGATIVFSPSTIAANGGQQTVTVTIQTAATSSRLQPDPMSPRSRVPLALALLLLPLFGVRRLRRQGNKLGRMLCILLLLLGSAATLVFSGCGGKSHLMQSPETYSVNITAASGSLQQSASVSLTVQ